MHFTSEVGESLTYKFAQAAGEMKSQGREIISLGLGEPDFATPQYILNATIEAMNGGYTHYSPSQGLPELRELIAEHINRLCQSDRRANEVIVTPGIKSAVYFAMCAILEPFDRIAVLSPYYVSYLPMIKLAEPTAEVICVKLDDDYSLDVDEVVRIMKTGIKCVLLNTPNNPTGFVLPKADTDVIVETAHEYGTYIIADEVYETLVYAGYEHTSFLKYPQINEKLVVCNGYSKSHAMTGWRLGYAIGPSEIITRMNKLQQHINTNTCTFIQKGACAIYRNEPVHIKLYLEELQKRADFLHGALSANPIIHGIKPNAGFFYFANISESRMDSNRFCVALLKATGIASTPGIAFGPEWDDHVRFSFAVPMETLLRAVKMMNEFSEGVLENKYE